MTKMKKILAIGLAGVLAVGFAACSNGGTQIAGNDGAATAAAAKTGYAVTASLGHASHGTEEDVIEINTVAAAVLVDADGKVITCQIDEAQTQPNLKENDGFVADDALRTKKQKLEDYGMKSASPIQKEWYEQVDAFEKWTVGKTADEIKACVDETGYATDADLKAGCTIWAGNFVKVVSEAITNAADKGASATDTLKLVMKTEKYYEYAYSIISEADCKKETELSDTLAEYIKQGCDKNQTCLSLGIHRNTLSFRLHCIEMLLGRKISEGEGMYALRFMELLRRISIFHDAEDK